MQDRASKGHGSTVFLVWHHRLICILVSLNKRACKEVCDVKSGIDPHPLLAQLCSRWWPDFLIFTACKKSRLGLKGAKRHNAFQTGAKIYIYLSEKNMYFGVRCTLRDWLASNLMDALILLFHFNLKDRNATEGHKLYTRPSNVIRYTYRSLKGWRNVIGFSYTVLVVYVVS